MDSEAILVKKLRYTACAEEDPQLLNHGGAFIIMSHMGNPKSKVNPKLSHSHIRGNGEDSGSSHQLCILLSHVSVV